VIEFRCPSCGESLRFDDGRAGESGSCALCGASVKVPEAPPAPGIRFEADSVGPVTPEAGEPREQEDAGASARQAARFELAEASCRLWKAGGLASDKTQHPVADVSRTGLRVLYSTRRKAKALAVAPKKPPWPVGTRVEVALSVGAFAKPIHLVAEIVRLEEMRDGCDLGLKVVEADEDARTRLGMLEEREDLRRRRKSGLFGGSYGA
jgi:hypothetical protein